MSLLLRSSFDAPPSTPPPPGRPQSTCPGEGSAPASPGRIRRVRTSPWISDEAHAKDLPCKIFPCRYLNKSCSYLSVIESLWEKYYSIFEKFCQSRTPHARAADKRTHNDTTRGFYDLYEFNLFISTTAPSTFNIKMISTWA